MKYQIFYFNQLGEKAASGRVYSSKSEAEKQANWENTHCDPIYGDSIISAVVAVDESTIGDKTIYDAFPEDDFLRRWEASWRQIEEDNHPCDYF